MEDPEINSQVPFFDTISTAIKEAEVRSASREKAFAKVCVEGEKSIERFIANEIYSHRQMERLYKRLTWAIEWCNKEINRSDSQTALNRLHVYRKLEPQLKKFVDSQFEAVRSLTLFYLQMELQKAPIEQVEKELCRWTARLAEAKLNGDLVQEQYALKAEDICQTILNHNRQMK